MPLFVVATPIGNPTDLSSRAQEILRGADLIIGEELKELRQILKRAGVQAKATDQLNEHSTAKDIEFLREECRNKTVALVSDCGTPGFCDPGAELTKACHRAGIEVHAVPGASSLMAFLSLAGVRLDQFLFFGFLPAKTEMRETAWTQIARESRPVILMETPYRCEKLIGELGKHFPDRFCVVGLNLTQPKQMLLRSLGRELVSTGEAEPIVLICPKNYRD